MGVATGEAGTYGEFRGLRELVEFAPSGCGIVLIVLSPLQSFSLSQPCSRNGGGGVHIIGAGAMEQPGGVDSYDAYA